MLLGIGALGAALPPPDDDPATLGKWIDELGGPRWEERERATEKLLEAGSDAVSLLRSRRDDPDPEVRQRIQWLLAILDPPRHTVCLIRLGAAAAEPQASEERSVREYLRVRLTGRKPEDGVTTNLDGEGTRFKVRIEGADDTGVLVQRPDRGVGLGARAALVPGTVVPLFREDLIEEERVEGRVGRELWRSLWVLWVPENEAGAMPEIEPELSQLGEALVRQQAASSDSCRHAYDVIGFLGRADWLGARATIEEDALMPWLTTQVRGGVESRRAELEALLHEGLSDRPEVEAALALLAAGSEVGLTHVLSQVGELSVWQKYQAIHLLVRRLEDPATTPENVQRILSSICAPETFAYLPWSGSVETELLIQLLQDRAPADLFRRHLAPLLEENLRTTDQSVYLREQVLLRALIRVVKDSRPPVETWLDSAMAALPGRHFDAGFGLLRDARLSGELGDEPWDRVLKTVGEALGSDAAGNARRADITIRRFLAAPDLTSDDVRKLLVARLACYDDETGYLRQSVDRELDTQFGKLETPAPGRDDGEAWSARRGARRAQIEDAGDELLRPPIEEGRRLQLTEADFRIDHDRRRVDLTRYRRREVQVGVAYPETGPDGEDRTTLVTAFGARQPQNATFRIGDRGRPLSLGRPELRGYYRSRNRFNSYRMSDVAFGRQSTDNRRSVAYQTLVMLEDVDEALVAEDWPALKRYAIERVSSENASERRAWLPIVQELLIQAALPSLRELFAKAPDSELALALLALGDPCGIELLRAEITEPKASQSVANLKKLIEFGDPSSIELGLRWVSEPPRGLRNRTYQIIDSLLRALWGPQPVARIDEDRALSALVDSLAERSNWHRVVPLLRRRTGQDFGFYEALQKASSAERQKAQQVAVKRWQDWWRSRPHDDD